MADERRILERDFIGSVRGRCGEQINSLCKVTPGEEDPARQGYRAGNVEVLRAGKGESSQACDLAGVVIRL